jgi:hypothetical protein
MVQKRFKDLHLAHLVWKGSEHFEMITVKMQPQTEACFTRTIFIENENSVKNIFVGTKRTTEYKTRKLLVVPQAMQCQILGSLMKWKMSGRKWLCLIRYTILEEMKQSARNVTRESRSSGQDSKQISPESTPTKLLL